MVRSVKRLKMWHLQLQVKACRVFQQWQSLAETQNSESEVHQWCAAKYVILTGELTQTKVTIDYPTICANMLKIITASGQ